MNHQEKINFLMETAVNNILEVISLHTGKTCDQDRCNLVEHFTADLDFHTGQITCGEHLDKLDKCKIP